MRQPFRIVLLSFLITILALPGYVAAKDASFTLSVSSHSSSKGEQIVVTVIGEELDDIYGYEISLKYDPAKLTYKKALSLQQGFSVPTNPQEGQVVFAHTKVGKTSGISGKAELAAVTFEAIGAAGTTEVELVRVKFVHSDLTDTSLSPLSKKEIVWKERGKTEALKDIVGHWAQETIERAVGMGFVNGYGDGTFRPDAGITRAEFVAMAARAFELGAAAGISLDFGDVDDIPGWARPYVAEATQAGIVTGYEDGSFRPGRLISRAEMAVMIMRLYGGELEDQAKPAFVDRELIMDWAAPSVAASVELGVIQGKPGNRFAPTDSATRAEATAMLLRLLVAMENERR